MGYAGLPDNAEIIEQPTFAGLPAGAQIIDAPQEQSFSQRVMDALSKRGTNISDNMTRPVAPYTQPGQPESLFQSVVQAPGRLFRTVGQVAGGVNDIIGEGLKSGYKTFMPQDTQDAIAGAATGLMQSAPIQAVAPLVQSAASGYDRFKQAYPEAAGDVSALANIAGLTGASVLGKKTVQGTADAASVLKGAVTPIPTLANIETKIDQAIVNGIQKGIKPTVVGKSDAGLVERYFNQAKTAVRDIVDNAETPLSQSQNVLEDFSKAQKNTKLKIWDDATRMSEGAGQQGATVSLQPAIDDMYKVIDNPNLARTNSAAINKIINQIETWEKLPIQIVPQEAENLLASLNNQAKSFWKDPNMHTEAALTERLAQQVRKQLYDTVEQYQGAGYDSLRKRYGAQLALEKEVADRATIAGRKAEYGFFDLANIPTAGEFVKSVLTADPVGLAKAGTMAYIKNKIKSGNDPSNIIRNMFKDVERLNTIKQRYAP